MDVRVAAEAARAITTARDAREGDEFDAPEFALESRARRRDDASSSSAWTTSESDDDASETSCESVDAADVPKWLARARDGARDDDDDDGDDDDDAPPRTRNEIVVDAATPTTPVAAIGSDEAIEAVGRVISVVGRTVVVQSARGEETRGEATDLDGASETLDEESVLCTEDRRGLGAIEEVFGPVSAPLYALRLPEDATARTGDEVFVVVGRSRRIPDVGKLYKKGYDASGKDDEEVVDDEEFSDDEEEAAARAARKKGSGKKRSSGARARGGGAKPSPMGGGGMFGMRGLPRPPPPPLSAAMGQMGVGGAPPPPPAAGQPMMSVPVRYDAQGRPTIVMPARAPPPPPPPPPSA